jgi:hypothetical protein
MLDPEAANECIVTSRSIDDAEAELQRCRKEIQEFVIYSSVDLLNDDRSIKQFQGASISTGRVRNHLIRQRGRQADLRQKFVPFFDASAAIFTVYSNSGLRIDNFMNILQETLIDCSGEGPLDDRLEKVFHRVTEKVLVGKATSRTFPGRLQLLGDEVHPDFATTIASIDEAHPHSEILICPRSLSALLHSTINRRPIIIRISTPLYRTLSLLDRFLFSAPSDCLSQLKRCVGDGRFLVTICSSRADIQTVVAIVARIRSLAQIAADFRFIILTDLSFLNSDAPSSFISDCDIVETNSQPTLKRLQTLNVTSLPFTVFDPGPDCPPMRFRRFLMLLTFFHASVRVIMETVYQLQLFDTHSYMIIVELSRLFAKAISTDLSCIRDFVINFGYSYLPEFVRKSLHRFWEQLFVDENFEAKAIKLFDQYQIPLAITSDTIAKQFDFYPPMDETSVFGFPSSAALPWQRACLPLWSMPNDGFFVTDPSIPSSHDEKRPLCSEFILWTAALSLKVRRSRIGLVAFQGSEDVGTVTVVNGSLNAETGKVEYVERSQTFDHFSVGPGPLEDGMIAIPIIFRGSAIALMFAKADSEISEGIIYAILEI